MARLGCINPLGLPSASTLALVGLLAMTSASAQQAPQPQEAPQQAKQPQKPIPFAQQAAKDWQQFQLLFRQQMIHHTALKPKQPRSVAQSLEAARRLMERQDYRAAQAVLERQLVGPRTKAEQRQLYLELATVHLYAGQTEAAGQVLRAAAEAHDPKTQHQEPPLRLRYLLAYYDHLTGNPRSARDRLTALISEAPQFLLGYTLLSQTFLSRGKLALAKDVLLRAIDNGLASPALDLRLGIIAMKAGEYQKAQKLLEGVLKAQPDNIVARINLGMTAMEQKRYKAAEASLLKARKLAPKRSFCHFALGLLYHRQHKFKKAADSYRLALQGPKPSPYLRYNYAMLLFKHQKNDPKGLQYLFEVTQLARPSTDIYKIARSLLAKAEDQRL